MTFGDVLKRLPATVVLLCGYAVSFITFKDNWETRSDASLAVRILLPFAAFALLTGSYLLSVLKDKKLLFRLVSLAAVFCCNVFSSEGTTAQTVLVIAFARSHHTTMRAMRIIGGITCLIQTPLN